MNNNRGNNRRRGRGNNRPQNGGQQLNRIDSRARGNAPQLLEKYRKLAQDAHLNGDRVQAEYYLQFADHYFRVIADTRLRQEEARARRDDRWQDQGDGARDDGDDGSDFSIDSDFPTFDTPPVYTRREREERGENERQSGERQNGDRQNGERQNGNRQPRREETVREEAAEEVSEGGETANIYEPPQNPFLRENRNPRQPRARRENTREERRPRREERGEESPAQVEGVGLEAALPPAISIPRKAAAADEATPASLPAEAAEAAPAPKRRTRRKPVSDAGETVEAAG